MTTNSSTAIPYLAVLGAMLAIACAKQDRLPLPSTAGSQHQALQTSRTSSTSNPSAPGTDAEVRRPHDLTFGKVAAVPHAEQLEFGVSREPGTPEGDSPSAPPSLVVVTETVTVEGDRARPSGTVAAAVADEELQRWNVGGRSDPSHIANRSNFHPGTRVRVDAVPRLSVQFLRSKQGLALTRAILASLRDRGYWPFRNCFESIAREHASPGGKTRLRLSVRGDGAIVQSRLLATELKQGAIASCQTAAARQLRIFPLRLRRVEVDVQVAVWPGDVPLLPAPVSSALIPALELREAARIIRQMEPKVVDCMRLARVIDPALWGRLAISFAVDGSSHPNELRERDSRFGDPNAIQCVAANLAMQELPTGLQRNVRLQAAWRLHPPNAAGDDVSKVEEAPGP